MRSLNLLVLSRSGRRTALIFGMTLYVGFRTSKLVYFAIYYYPHPQGLGKIYFGRR